MSCLLVYRLPQLKAKPYLLKAFLVLCLCSQSSRAEHSVSVSLLTLLNSKQHPLLQQMDFSRDSQTLTQLYRAKAMQPLWLGKDRSDKNLNDALTVLSKANEDGLNPENYDNTALHHYIRQALEQREISNQTLAAYDLALSVAILRYCHDLQLGRVDPRSFNYPPTFASKPSSHLAIAIKTHIDQQNIADLPVDLAPRLKQYQLLKQALAFYHEQAELPVKTSLTLSTTLHPGDHDPQLPELRLRLMDMGLLSSEELANVVEDTLYDDIAKLGITRLQQQQGLNADGFVGKQTLALLNQSIKDKITLIELALERLRWLPKLPEGRQIFVNIPAFQLWALNSPDDENPLSMKVVVGNAKDHQTPILLEEMKYLVFMPFWNIPRSILDKEIMPKIQNETGFLQKQAIEFVETVDDDPEPNDTNYIHQLKHGFMRARQRPGGKNPLGKVKFIFPNKADVYLHDTPSRGAFTRDRRDLSHGCVRVSDAEKLAEFVLKNQQGWDKQTIEQAMTGDKTHRVSLKTAIPVLFYYTTAYADQNHKLRFYPDIYGYDQQLQGMLNVSPNQQLAIKPVINDG